MFYIFKTCCIISVLFPTKCCSFIHSFHWHVQNATIPCRSLELLPFFFVMSGHPSPPIILSSSLTSSCHLFLGLPLNLVVPKFIYNTLLGILFSSILCTHPNQCNLFDLFQHLHNFLYWLISPIFFFIVIYWA